MYTYSNTHRPVGQPQWVRMERQPFSSNTTISPGSTSRTNSPPAAVMAQLSLAMMSFSPSLPMHSGRKPCGSRAAMSLRGLITTSEYAPFSLSIVCSTACSMLSEERRSRVMA